MCGLVGIVAQQGPADLERILARMNDVIVHRGPDDCGAYIALSVGLAMRRLSIIDVEGGHQPMHTPDGVTVVFNGEIYNYIQLRRELMARGYVFKTKSDTEVILNLYHAEGIAAFRKLNGMFGIAIHDPRTNELVLVRDQVGMKPLYYCVTPERFAFASEIKSILTALPAKPAVNPVAVWDYLSLAYVPSPKSIWQGIMKLEPGHLLRFSLTQRQPEILEYWKPDLTPAPFDPGRNYAREFEQQFLAAVESHIIASDVPVGAFLSGGLDSGSICAAAIELGHRNFHTFSIGSDVGGRDDELDLARKVSKQLGTEHHQIVMTPDMYFDQLDTVAWHFDEPYGDDTAAALLMLSRLARQHVKVAMSGEGSDELLLGYTPARGLANLARVERRYRQWPGFLLKSISPLFSGRRRSVLSAIAAEGPWAYSKGAAVSPLWFADDEKKPIWRGGTVRRSHELIAGWYTLPTTVHPLAQTQQAMFQSWLVENQLMKSDKMGMAASLEIRAPFLHLPLVEWCESSPLEARLGRSFREGDVKSKSVVREFAASRLPAEILQAPKRGFPLPVFGWLAQMFRDQGRFVPVSRSIHEWINIGALDKFVAKAASGERGEIMKLFDLMMLDRWFKTYVD